MKHHPAADIFPAMSDTEFASLVENMRKYGYDKTFPVLRYLGAIVDGRHRYRAAHAAGVQPVFVELEADADPYAASWRANSERRHLSVQQRSALALACDTGTATLATETAAAKERRIEGNRQGAETKWSVKTSSSTIPTPTTTATPTTVAPRPKGAVRDKLVEKYGGNAQAFQIAISAQKQTEDPTLFADLCAGTTGPKEALQRLKKVSRPTGPTERSKEILERMKALEESDESAALTHAQQAAKLSITENEFRNLRQEYMRPRVNPLQKSTETLEVISEGILRHLDQYNLVRARCQPSDLEAFAAAINDLFRNVKKLKENTK